MNAAQLREILAKIRDESLRRDVVRQDIQILVRKIARLSKQAIFLTHKGMISDADFLLKETSSALDRVRELLKTCQDFSHAGLIDSALEEYSEAQIFLKLIRDGKFAYPEEIDVPGELYVLGLADVIGELRRRSLDLIRRGDINEAEECLALMETIYNEIMGCDELLVLVPGLRRKCDIARRVIEATRGDVTAEVGRAALSNTIKEFQKVLENMISRER